MRISQWVGPIRRNEKSKPSKVCIIAIMRKMIRVLNRLIAPPNFTLAS